MKGQSPGIGKGQPAQQVPDEPVVIDPATITLDEQIASVKREIGMRAGVYPAWVRGGRLTKEKAAHETAAMKAVLDSLEKVKKEKEKK